jgi:hypothetical protein
MKLKELIQQRPYPLFEAVSVVSEYPEAKVLEAIRWLLEHKILKKDANGNLTMQTQLNFDS